VARQGANTGEKVIATNPIAHQNYFLDEVVEAGLVLTGTEVKSLRALAPNLRDSYVEVNSKAGKIEAWLMNVHIGPYTHGNIWNHDPMRKRKLLMHAHQLKKLYGAVIQDGMSVIPTRMYFKNGLAKIEIATGKGKKMHDKRQTLKAKSAEREMDLARKHGR
jgi:SsrA-binding protein